MIWNGDQFLNDVRIAVSQRIEAVAAQFVVNVQDTINVACPLFAAQQAARGRRFTTGMRGKALSHSPPGEPPYRETGLLRASIHAEIDSDAMRARVGTTVRYGPALELGNHPFLRRALAEQTTSIVEKIKNG